MTLHLTDTVVPRQLTIAVRVLGVVFVEQPVFRDDINGPLLLADRAHLPDLVVDNWKFELIVPLLVIIDIRLHWLLLIIVTVKVTMWLIV